MEAKTIQHISHEVDSWIAKEELAPRANLKVLKAFDPYEGMDEDEIEAYHDFRHWYMTLDFAPIMALPKQETEDDFIPFESDGDLTLSFPFSSMDFKRQHAGSFNKYSYRVKKVYERVKDLAQTYSCLSHQEGKDNRHRRFKALVEEEFRDEAVMILDSLKTYGAYMNKKQAMLRIAALNKHIEKCNEIWKKHACQD